MSKWISVKDRLPEKNGDYLVSFKGIVKPVTVCHFDSEWYWIDTGNTETVTGIAQGVKFWMSLPEPPQ